MFSVQVVLIVLFIQLAPSLNKDFTYLLTLFTYFTLLTYLLTYLLSYLLTYLLGNSSGPGINEPLLTCSKFSLSVMLISYKAIPNPWTKQSV